jgi:hypothetical protein
MQVRFFAKKADQIPRSESQDTSISMENRCEMAIKHWFMNKNGSSLHRNKQKTKKQNQEIGRTEITLAAYHMDFFYVYWSFYTCLPSKLCTSHV